jgi:hypothetical protein
MLYMRGTNAWRKWNLLEKTAFYKRYRGANNVPNRIGTQLFFLLSKIKGVKQN